MNLYHPRPDNPNSRPRWTVARTDTFHTLRAILPPLSAVQIARELKVSTNAIRGKLYRLRIARLRPQ